MNSYDAIKESRTWLPSTGPHPILKKLKEGKENNEAGWLRKEVKKALKLPSTPIGQFEMNEVGGLDSLRYDTLGATVIKKIHHNSIPRRPLSKSKV